MQSNAVKGIVAAIEAGEALRGSEKHQSLIPQQRFRLMADIAELLADLLQKIRASENQYLLTCFDTRHYEFYNLNVSFTLDQEPAGGWAEGRNTQNTCTSRDTHNASMLKQRACACQLEYVFLSIIIRSITMQPLSDTRDAVSKPPGYARLFRLALQHNRVRRMAIHRGVEEDSANLGALADGEAEWLVPASGGR